MNECLISTGFPFRTGDNFKQYLAIMADLMPRDAMAKMLVDLGEPAPAPRTAKPAAQTAPGGFHCKRPGCMWGARARQLPQPPMSDAVGQQIYENVCAGCWEEWLRNFSIKVINELRLDLSTPHGQNEYDRHMREFLGVE